MNKKRCLNCVYFIKIIHTGRDTPAPEIIDEITRKSIMENTFDFDQDGARSEYGCYLGMWEIRHGVKEENIQIIKRKRSKECGFTKFNNEYKHARLDKLSEYTLLKSQKDNNIKNIFLAAVVSGAISLCVSLIVNILTGNG